jgi:chromosome segregation ATPase
MAVKAIREPVTPLRADDFHSLEEKVYRAIESLKAARAAKDAAERDVARVRQQMADRADELGSLRHEMVALRREREEVRSRVEKLLKQIEALTADESGR